MGSPTPRKAARSEGISNVDNYGLVHDKLPQLFRITSGQAQHGAVYMVMSLANKRFRDGAWNGWCLVTSEMLAEYLIEQALVDGKSRDQRAAAVKQAERVVKEGCSRGLFRRKTLAEARKENSLTEDERRFAARHPRAFFLSTDPDQWKKVPTYEYVAPADERAPDDDSDAAGESENVEQPEVIHLTKQPYVIKPMAAAEPIPLSKEARRALGRCDRMECTSTLPLAVEFSIHRAGSLTIQLSGEDTANRIRHASRIDLQEQATPTTREAAPVRTSHPDRASPAGVAMCARVKLEEFPQSVKWLREHFPATDSAMIRDMFTDCRLEVIKRGGDPALVGDEFLLGGMKSVLLKTQHSAGLFWRKRDGSPGTLLAAIINWAESEARAKPPTPPHAKQSANDAALELIRQRYLR